MNEPLILILDDDPTGIQTVHGVRVYYRWSAGTFRSIFAHDRLAFIQTNSRSLPEAEAVQLTRDIVRLALAASHETGRDFRIISRSDSSLRGHFPAETDAICQMLAEAGQRTDGLLLCYVLPEAGRETVGNVHHIRQADGTLVRVSDTEFARDATFGYQSADLTQFVAEKTGGRIRAEAVQTIPLDWLDTGNVPACLNRLQSLENGAVIVSNGLNYNHLHVLVDALHRAEAGGKRYVFRTAAAFIKAYARIPDHPLLTPADLATYLLPGPVLTVVGSHTANTTRQLTALLQNPGAAGIELNVAGVRSDVGAVVQQAIEQVTNALAAGQQPVLFTSRELQGADISAAAALAFSRTVSDALMTVVQAFPVRPRAVIAKGGITSSDVATRGLLMQQGLILGQIRPSIPVVLTGTESRFPELPYIIFPGNTGTPDDLSSIWQALTQ